MTIPIFYSISDDFVPYAAVSLQSLVKSANANNDYTVYFLCHSLSDDHKDDLKKLATPNIHVEFSDIAPELVAPIQDRPENFLRADFFSLSIFYRLFIPQLFPKYDKVIYLDSDTVVNHDIAELYNTDLTNSLFAACVDSSIQQVPEMIDYIQNVMNIDPTKYINSGVLIMNAKMFREKHFTKAFLELMNQYHFDCIAPDQDYLNKMGEGEIKYLDPRWDAMPNEHTKPFNDPYLIHYNLFFKPWHFSPIQYENYFWDNAKQTPYYQVLKDELHSYTKEQKRIDYRKLKTMLQKGSHELHNPY